MLIMHTHTHTHSVVCTRSFSECPCSRVVCRQNDVALVTDSHSLTHAEVEEGKTFCGTVSTEDTATVATVVLQMSREGIWGDYST